MAAEVWQLEEARKDVVKTAGDATRSLLLKLTIKSNLCALMHY